MEINQTASLKNTTRAQSSFILGGNDVLYSEIDFLHDADKDDISWQESVVLMFDDRNEGVSGFLRIGSEPNRGTSQVHFNLTTDEGQRFRHNLVDLEMGRSDRTDDGFAAGSLIWRIPNNEYVHVTADEKDASIDLCLFDYFPSMPCWKMIGVPDDMDVAAPHHYESSGRIEGRVRIGDRIINIENGLGHRDHSWGHRDTTIMRSFRWFAGTMGPELSFSTLIFHDSEGREGKGGWVVRDGTKHDLAGLDILTYVNSDGFTIRGGVAEFVLETGEKLHLKVDTLDGFATSYRSELGGYGFPFEVEGMSIVTCGDLAGFCDLEVGNLICGAAGPAAAICEEYGTTKRGLSRRPQLPSKLIS